MAAIATRLGFAAMAVLLLWAASLQLNDPDPLRWIALYGGAAGLCLAGAASRPLHPAAGLALAGVALAYGAQLTWVIASGGADPMYGDAEARNPALLDLEQGREVAGLALVALASAAHAGWSWWRRRG